MELSARLLVEKEVLSLAYNHKRQQIVTGDEVSIRLWSMRRELTRLWLDVDSPRLQQIVFEEERDIFLLLFDTESEHPDAGSIVILHSSLARLASFKVQAHTVDAHKGNLATAAKSSVKVYQLPDDICGLEGLEPQNEFFIEASSVKFSVNNQLYAVSGSHVYSIKEKSDHLYLKEESTITCLEPFSQDCLALGLSDGRLRIWNRRLLSATICLHAPVSHIQVTHQFEVYATTPTTVTRYKLRPQTPGPWSAEYLAEMHGSFLNFLHVVHLPLTRGGFRDLVLTVTENSLLLYQALTPELLLIESANVIQLSSNRHSLLALTKDGELMQKDMNSGTISKITLQSNEQGLDHDDDKDDQKLSQIKRGIAHDQLQRISYEASGSILALRGNGCLQRLRADTPLRRNGVTAILAMQKNCVVAGDEDGGLTFFSAHDNTIERMDAHNAIIIALTHYNDFLASAAADRTAKVWLSTASLTCIGSCLLSSVPTVSGLALLPHHKTEEETLAVISDTFRKQHLCLVNGTNGGMLNMWQFTYSDEDSSPTKSSHKAHTLAITVLDAQPTLSDRWFLMSSSLDRTIGLWSFENSTLSFVQRVTLPHPVLTAIMVPRGSKLTAFIADTKAVKSITLYDLNDEIIEESKKKKPPPDEVVLRSKESAPVSVWSSLIVEASTLCTRDIFSDQDKHCFQKSIASEASSVLTKVYWSAECERQLRAAFQRHGLGTDRVSIEAVVVILRAWSKASDAEISGAIAQRSIINQRWTYEDIRKTALVLASSCQLRSVADRLAGPGGYRKPPPNVKRKSRKYNEMNRTRTVVEYNLMGEPSRKNRVVDSERTECCGNKRSQKGSCCDPARKSSLNNTNHRRSISRIPTCLRNRFTELKVDLLRTPVKEDGKPIEPMHPLEPRSAILEARRILRAFAPSCADKTLANTIYDLYRRDFGAGRNCETRLTAFLDALCDLRVQEVSILRTFRSMLFDEDEGISQRWATTYALTVNWLEEHGAARDSTKGLCSTTTHGVEQLACYRIVSRRVAAFCARTMCSTPSIASGVLTDVAAMDAIESSSIFWDDWIDVEELAEIVTLAEGRADDVASRARLRLFDNELFVDKSTSGDNSARLNSLQKMLVRFMQADLTRTGALTTTEFCTIIRDGLSSSSLEEGWFPWIPPPRLPSDDPAALWWDHPKERNLQQLVILYRDDHDQLVCYLDFWAMIHTETILQGKVPSLDRLYDTAVTQYIGMDQSLCDALHEILAYGNFPEQTAPAKAAKISSECATPPKKKSVIAAAFPGTFDLEADRPSNLEPGTLTVGKPPPVTDLFCGCATKHCQQSSDEPPIKIVSESTIRGTDSLALPKMPQPIAQAELGESLKLATANYATSTVLTQTHNQETAKKQQLSSEQTSVIRSELYLSDPLSPPKRLSQESVTKPIAEDKRKLLIRRNVHSRSAESLIGRYDAIGRPAGPVKAIEASEQTDEAEGQTLVKVSRAALRAKEKAAKAAEEEQLKRERKARLADEVKRRTMAARHEHLMAKAQKEADKQEAELKAEEARRIQQFRDEAARLESERKEAAKNVAEEQRLAREREEEREQEARQRAREKRRIAEDAEKKRIEQARLAHEAKKNEKVRAKEERKAMRVEDTLSSSLRELIREELREMERKRKRTTEAREAEAMAAEEVCGLVLCDQRRAEDAVAAAMNDLELLSNAIRRAEVLENAAMLAEEEYERARLKGEEDHAEATRLKEQLLRQRLDVNGRRREENERASLFVRNMDQKTHMSFFAAASDTIASSSNVKLSDTFNSAVPSSALVKDFASKLAQANALRQSRASPKAKLESGSASSSVPPRKQTVQFSLSTPSAQSPASQSQSRAKSSRSPSKVRSPSKPRITAQPPAVGSQQSRTISSPTNTAQPQESRPTSSRSPTGQSQAALSMTAQSTPAPQSQSIQSTPAPQSQPIQPTIAQSQQAEPSQPTTAESNIIQEKSQPNRPATAESTAVQEYQQGRSVTAQPRPTMACPKQSSLVSFQSRAKSTRCLSSIPSYIKNLKAPNESTAESSQPVVYPAIGCDLNFSDSQVYYPFDMETRRRSLSEATTSIPKVKFVKPLLHQEVEEVTPTLSPEEEENMIREAVPKQLSDPTLPEPVRTTFRKCLISQRVDQSALDDVYRDTYDDDDSELIQRTNAPDFETLFSNSLPNLLEQMRGMARSTLPPQPKERAVERYQEIEATALSIMQQRNETPEDDTEVLEEALVKIPARRKSRSSKRKRRQSQIAKSIAKLSLDEIHKRMTLLSTKAAPAACAPRKCLTLEDKLAQIKPLLRTPETPQYTMLLELNRKNNAYVTPLPVRKIGQNRSTMVASSGLYCNNNSGAAATTLQYRRATV